MMRRSNNAASSFQRQCGSGANDPAGSQWIDISVTLRDSMVHWPSDPPVRIVRAHDMERGDTTNLSTISISLHTGTHMDAPLHFIRQGIGIDKLPLNTTVGRARVIEIQDTESIKIEELLQHQIIRGERILFKTRNSSRVWQADNFIEDFVYISKDAARFLVERKVKVVGIDYLSVGGFKYDSVETHQTLLEGGVWIIEGLNLSFVSPGKYDLICLPLKVEQGDGAPARAILRPVRTSKVN